MRRKPEDERWDGEMIKKLQGTPQKPNPHKPGAHIGIRIRMEDVVRLQAEEHNTERKETNLRRFRITIPMLNTHGYTVECERCRSKQARLSNARTNGESCRRRIADALKANNEDVQIVYR